jgi:Zn-dependent protease
MTLIISLVLFFLAIVIHEYAHGWVAYRLGDPTAKYSGRLTLNPLAHIDMTGTIILPLSIVIMNLLSGSHIPVIGWAKPVPINFFGLRNPKKDIFWVGLAGPAANICFAYLISLLLRSSLIGQDIYLHTILATLLFYNLMLAVFNLVPIPPLDGSRILFSLLPRPYDYKLMLLEPYGFIILFFLIYLGVLNWLVIPGVEILARFMGVGQWL